MKLINWLLSPFRWIKSIFQKLKRRWILAKAYPALKKANDEQLIKRKKLKKDIMLWLRSYFGIDAKSKYIPKDFKNKEEVKAAVLERFGNDLQQLNLNYSDIFA
ncbi:MAG: hypothetical protein CMO82_11260 [Winogradskyella sp.]|jgi:hypothetical protein|nr:hypothetical protein [Winogradskyella sp.]|tara:strand:+ start:39 stop:350 length:312 start_codon:yes stop_codon:yes gene_type:complete